MVLTLSMVSRPVGTRVKAPRWCVYCNNNTADRADRQTDHIGHPRVGGGGLAAAAHEEEQVREGGREAW